MITQWLELPDGRLLNLGLVVWIDIAKTAHVLSDERWELRFWFSADDWIRLECKDQLEAEEIRQRISRRLNAYAF